MVEYIQFFPKLEIGLKIQADINYIICILICNYKPFYISINYIYNEDKSLKDM